MQITSSSITSIIADYLAGDMPEEKRIIFERQIARDAELADLVAQLRKAQAYSGSHIPLRYVEYEARVKAVSARLDEILASETTDSVKINKGIINRVGLGAGFGRKWFQAGAGRPSLYIMVTTLVLILGIGTSKLFLGRVDNGAPYSQASSSVSTYTTSNGERAAIKLADGSSVLLNVGSSLKVPVNYGQYNRTVELSGEALFTVNHSGKHPFIIKAGASVTRVLGTSFIVRHYQNDFETRVAVREGKVDVGGTVVTALQQITVSERGEASDIQHINGNPFSFESGVLQLEHMPLGKAIQELNRWYNADIRIADKSLASAIIGGQFSEGSILELMEQLTVSLDVQIERDGHILTLRRRID